MKHATADRRGIIFEKLDEYDGHESVTFITDKKSGLRGFIAIHNTNLGPAVGGTRFWYYESETEALRDALRLSRAMTYKCALAGVRYGGGKAVLMAPRPGAKMTKAFGIAYAQRLNSFDCPFFTGEDVGLRDEDVRLLARHAPTCIIGKPQVGGLPSEWAALSVFYSMKAAMRERFGSDDFKGLTVAIKGVGNVGYDLAVMLSKEGASVVASDIRPERIALVRKKVPGARIVASEQIHRIKADIYAPCALGNEFDARKAATISCKIICGAANNQLSSPDVGRTLHKRQIMYVPDYVANAGGLINVVDELNPKGYSRARVVNEIESIQGTVHDIIRRSKATGRPESDVADELAERRFGARV